MKLPQSTALILVDVTAGSRWDGLLISRFREPLLRGVLSASLRDTREIL
jgi:hypothetical protein